MKFIMTVSNLVRDWKLASQITARAEELGFWGLGMPDHYLWAAGMDDATMDTWFALSHLASETNSIHVGTIVTPIPFRPPAVLAKMVSTLDIISNGRTFLGVGAGWSQREFEAYSEWDKPSVRVAKTAEGLELIRKLWTVSGVLDFRGKYYHTKGGVLEPKPLQKPHPPFLFGGFSPRMIRLAGQYGDIIFIPPWIKLSFDEARDIALDSARRSGRTDDISFAAGSPVTGIPPKIEKYELKSYRDSVVAAEESGCRYFILYLPDEDLMNSLNDFASNIMPSFS